MKQYAAHLRSLICKGIGADESDKPLAGMRIMVDAGNGAGGFYASEVLTPLGADVSPSMNLEPDGNFPVYVPNPESTVMIDSAAERVKQTKPISALCLIPMLTERAVSSRTEENSTATALSP